MQEDLREIRRNEIRTRPLSNLRNYLDNSPSIPPLRPTDFIPVSGMYMPTYSGTAPTTTNNYRSLSRVGQEMFSSVDTERAMDYLRNYASNTPLRGDSNND